MNDLSLLIKFPSRERAQRFFQVLNLAQRNRELATTRFLITLDANDPHMNSEQSRKTLGMWGNLQYYYGVSESKIHAINRDMDKAGDWDILLLLSDDMVPLVKGYDRIIVENFKKHFQDTDGILWINDGHRGKMVLKPSGAVDLEAGINTIICMGRKYYERFGYLYYPGYKSLFCDNEYTLEAVRIGKFHYIPEVLIHHQHPMNSPQFRAKHDNLYRRNDAHFHTDKRLYQFRKDKVLA